MRIVAGRFRGYGLAGPRGRPGAGATVRPTSDRLRETLFNILAHGHGDAVTGARVLDLFAGTGALGLEALSRGAAFALFVDDSSAGRALLRANIEALGLGGVTKVFRRDATRLGQAHPHAPFSLVFCDPPYGRGLAAPALASAASGGWLAPGALIVVEAEADAVLAPPAGLSLIETRGYGDTQLCFIRAGHAPNSSRIAEDDGVSAAQTGARDRRA